MLGVAQSQLQSATPKSPRSDYLPSSRPDTAPGGFVTGLFHSKHDHFEYLISDFSFMVVKGGESFPSSDFRFDLRTRHLVACALNWVFDFYFSADFDTIESGTCRHLTTFVTRTYGTGPDQILFKRVHDAHFERLGKGALSEPTLYFVHGDQVAFIFSEYIFVVLMDGKEYVSSEYVFDAKTRHVRAKAHLWRFDFYFSRDYSYVERGSYYNVHNGETLHFGTGLGQLFFEKDTGGGAHTKF